MLKSEYVNIGESSFGEASQSFLTAIDSDVKFFKRIKYFGAFFAAILHAIAAGLLANASPSDSEEEEAQTKNIANNTFHSNSYL